MEERKEEKNVENKAGEEAEKRAKARKTEKNEQPKKTENKSSRLIEIDSAELERLNRKIAQNRMQDSRQENRTENIKKEKKIDNKVESDRQRNWVESNQSEKKKDNIRDQKVDSNKTEKIQKKKRKLTALFIILGILLMLVAGFFLGKVLYKYIKVDNSQVNEFMNTLNGGNHNEEENILNVIIDEPSPSPTEEPTPTPTDKAKDIPYYIKVNYGANTVTVYKKDKNGEYKTPYKAFICSTGTATPTSGVYPITDQYTWRLLERKCLWSICL